MRVDHDTSTEDLGQLPPWSRPGGLPDFASFGEALVPDAGVAVRIEDGAYIGNLARITGVGEVVIGPEVMLADRVYMRIGEGAVVGANSVVTQDVPDFSVVVGNPARVVRQHDGEGWRSLEPRSS